MSILWLFKRYILAVFHGSLGVKKIWDLTASIPWRSLPPGCPSAEDIKIYKMNFDSLPEKKRILVLGATAELREAAFSGFKEVFICDFSNSMIEKESHYLGKEIVRREIICLSDWLNLRKHFPSNYFDCIAGDIITRQIKEENLETFFANISYLLKNNGLFVTRAYNYNYAFKNIPADIILRNDLEEFQKGNRGITYQTRLRIYDKYINISPLVAAIDICRAILFQSPGSEFFLKLVLGNDFAILGRRFTHLSEARLEQTLKKYFRIMRKNFSNNSPDSAFYPIYALSKICGKLI